MKPKSLIYFLLLLLFPITNNAQNSQHLHENAIKKILMSQQDAWNAGDLEAFMSAYAKTDSISFMGRNGITYGWHKVLKNYKNAYPDLEAMGKLSFEINQTTALGELHYLVLGKYTLMREFDQPSGYFSLIWKNINGNWKIINDHTSVTLKLN